MKYLTDSMRDTLRMYASQLAPQEMCGAIIHNGTAYEFIPVANTHETPTTHFRMRAESLDFITTKYGVIIAFVHSHPKGSSDPSAEDMSQMGVHNKPYVIVGMDGDISVTEPKRSPLLGRQYVHGTQDCFGIIRDYYARELGIFIKDYARDPNWWQNSDNPSLYIEHYTQEGFVEVDKNKLQRHDVLLCREGDTQHLNHAYIYLGDDGDLLSEESPECVGESLVMHHPYNGVSCRRVLGAVRLATCEIAVRHGSLNK